MSHWDKESLEDHGFEGELSVVAGTVTYGDRAHLCSKAVNGAFEAGANKVVIVDNGASQDSRLKLEALAGRNERVILLRPELNRGSAVGFTDAIDACSKIGSFVWLLDDDNVPDPGSLTVLREIAKAPAGSGPAVLFSRRLSDSFHERVIRGSGAYPPRGSFMYFDLVSRLRFALRPAKRNLDETIEVPYGPYGGLFARSDVLTSIAPPKASMVLYEDDSEFTSRLADFGCKLALCQYSVIRDIDGKWSESVNGTGPSRLLANSQSGRMAMAARNRAFFDSGRARRNRLRYRTNRWIYIGVAFAQSVCLGKVVEFLQLVAAIHQGELRSKQGDAL